MSKRGGIKRATRRCADVGRTSKLSMKPGCRFVGNRRGLKATVMKANAEKRRNGQTLALQGREPPRTQPHLAPWFASRGFHGGPRTSTRQPVSSTIQGPHCLTHQHWPAPMPREDPKTQTLPLATYLESSFREQLAAQLRLCPVPRASRLSPPHRAYIYLRPALLIVLITRHNQKAGNPVTGPFIVSSLFCNSTLSTCLSQSLKICCPSAPWPRKMTPNPNPQTTAAPHERYPSVPHISSIINHQST